MSDLDIRSADSCRYDLVSLGEVMLRFDPGEGRIRNARTFRVWEGGGEYNVARGLRRCFGLRTAIVTAFADNAVGRLLEDLILQGGVDTSLVRWVPHDGIGRDVRNGLNFTERGFGIRGALGVSDRGNSAASQLAPGQVDWDHVLGTLGARWLHTGGIFAALAATTPEVIEEAFLAAERHGTIISYDLNYRPSLWKANGGVERARAVNRRLARHVRRDDRKRGGLHRVPRAGRPGHPPGPLRVGCRVIPRDDRRGRGNLRQPQGDRDDAADRSQRDDQRLGRHGWARETGFVEATLRPGLEILDRVGGGDSFAAGLIFGLLELSDLQLATDYGAAHGALAMTTPGDTSTAIVAEVESLVRGAGARVQR